MNNPLGKLPFPVSFYIGNPELTSKASGTQFLVLLALASFASRSLGECYPSKKRIADIAHMHERNVFRHVKALEKLGYLKCHERMGQPTSHGATNIYQLCDYRELALELPRSSDGRELELLLSQTLFRGMKSDKGRLFELRRAIEVGASRVGVPLDNGTIQALREYLDTLKYEDGEVILSPDKVSKQVTAYLRELYFLPSGD